MEWQRGYLMRWEGHLLVEDRMVAVATPFVTNGEDHLLVCDADGDLGWATLPIRLVGPSRPDFSVGFDEDVALSALPEAFWMRGLYATGTTTLWHLMHHDRRDADKWRCGCRNGSRLYRASSDSSGRKPVEKAYERPDTGEFARCASE